MTDTIRILPGQATTSLTLRRTTALADCTSVSSDPNGLIRPNDLRPLVRGKVAPRRIGAFSSAARAAELVVDTGEWQISDDHEGKNAGRPCRVLRWIGGDL